MSIFGSQNSDRFFLEPTVIQNQPNHSLNVPSGDFGFFARNLQSNECESWAHSVANDVCLQRLIICRSVTET